MTKPTDSSHSADSGVSGNDQTRATEIRLPEIDGYFVGGETKWLRLPNGNLIDTEATTAEIAFYTECSRLASRVEELREFLKWKVTHATERINETSALGHHHIPLTSQLNGYLQGERDMANDALSKLYELGLAGAHAEEKSK